MAFATVDQWQARMNIPQVARIPLGYAVPPQLQFAFSHRGVERAVAAALALIIAWVTLSTMAAWLGFDARSDDRRPTVEAMPVHRHSAAAMAHRGPLTQQF